MHLVRDSLSAAEDRGGLRPRVAIVGLGNPLRGDDGAGPLAVAAAREQLGGAGVAVLLIEQPLDLADGLQGYEGAFIVDACLCALPLGDVVSFSWPAEALEGYRSPSTHTMSLSQALALGATLGQLPPLVRVFAISGKEFGIGQPVGAAVRSGALVAAERIVEEVRACLSG
ncbi:MAG TPA: hydrogenase maturation protease [Fimbriimonadaceae bacterium]|nr:hydrogenase maturation protease [Fimbriimonadaceae bacterium]